MALTPEYGETPVDDDEAQALTPEIPEQLGEPVTKADIYVIEQEIEAEVAASSAVKIIEGDLGLNDLMTDFFLRDLHKQLYGDIWTWAGKFRQRELNVGVAPESIAAELRTSLENMLYRFEHTEDWTETAAPHGSSPISSSSPHRTASSSRDTTGIWIKAPTSPGRLIGT